MLFGNKGDQMIKKRTVLVLGAGASQPYGLPLGSELKKEILDGIPSEGNDLFRRLQDLGNDSDEIASFHDNLLNSDQPSVDAFLEHWPEFLNMGKQTMAACLIPKENKSQFAFRSKEGDSWYQYLVGKLNVTSPDKFMKNKLAIVTFNYDRSIEHYLFTTIKSRYDFQDKECADLINEIPIIHVHGSLGNLPWQGYPFMPYGRRSSTPHVADISDAAIKLASNQIKVVSEADKRAQEFKKAFQVMDSATKIFFLGFGYYELNLKRLRIKSITGYPDYGEGVYGTSYGMGNSDLEIINRRWNIKFKDPVKIYDFLRNHVILE